MCHGSKGSGKVFHISVISISIIYVISICISIFIYVSICLSIALALGQERLNLICNI